jgi:hypothetical protein
MQEHYDYATLRMYYRITDYRSNNPLYCHCSGSDSPSHQPLSTTNNENIWSQLPNCGRDGNDSDDEQATAATTAAAFLPEESDAIFEMDL